MTEDRPTEGASARPSGPGPTPLRDTRGAIAFVALTFILTYGADAVIIALARRIPVAYGVGVAVTMFFPAIAALAVRKLLPAPDDPGLGLKLGPGRYYLHVAWIVPALFAGAYVVTWLTGAGTFDPTLGYLKSFIHSIGMKATPEQMAVFDDPRYIPIVLLGSLTYAPFINSVAAFGEELGWRGYLWPRLRPLGFWPGTLVLGVIWGLWHAPIIVALGFDYPGHPVAGVVWMCGLTTLVSASINQLVERTGSTYLAAWVHGVLNAQAYGIWRAMTWPVNVLVGGFSGLIGFAFMAVPAIWLASRRSAEVRDARPS